MVQLPAFANLFSLQKIVINSNTFTWERSLPDRIDVFGLDARKRQNIDIFHIFCKKIIIIGLFPKLSLYLHIKLAYSNNREVTLNKIFC